MCNEARRERVDGEFQDSQASIWQMMGLVLTGSGRVDVVQHSGYDNLDGLFKTDGTNGVGRARRGGKGHRHIHVQRRPRAARLGSFCHQPAKPIA